MIAHDLFPNCGHVATTGVQGSEKGRAELNAAVFQSIGKGNLGFSLWACLAGIRIDVRQDFRTEWIGTHEVMIPALYGLPRNIFSYRLELDLASVNVVNMGELSHARYAN